MPKKTSNKAKEKKAKRIQEREKEKAKQDKVRQAMFEDPDKDKDTSHHEPTIRNVLKPDFAPLARYNRNGLDVELEFSAPALMQDEVKDWVLDLTKRNMMQLYINAHWGWADAEKRKELMEDSARYIIARNKEDGKPVGFVHFRFIIEGHWEVLYVYELQLEEEVHRKGLGKHMMSTIELIGRKWGMKWVMLTVFKENTTGLKFYMDKMGYRIDELSPSMNDVRGEYPYEILSKCLDPELRKADATKFESRNKLHSHRNTAEKVLKGREEASQQAASAAGASGSTA
eukprot:gb/GECG01005816.1/.p1 GENE.gb/GECG01005816.1/~~gb/GECG01005816.1/.p1  ORF type:complete len:286 (+),score=52.38 gb/GECG01005816.1/:1-858(+)